MAQTLNKFQMLNFTSWKGLTKDNHLGAIFQKSPQKATNLMVQMLSTQYGKSLETYLSKFKKKEFEIDDLKNLPLFFKTIYYNEMSNLDDENKLMKFNKKLNAIQMRHYELSSEYVLI